MPSEAPPAPSGDHGGTQQVRTGARHTFKVELTPRLSLSSRPSHTDLCINLQATPHLEASCLRGLARSLEACSACVSEHRWPHARSPQSLTTRVTRRGLRKSPRKLSATAESPRRRSTEERLLSSPPRQSGKQEQEKPRKRLRLAEAELGTALDVKLAEWVRHLESRPRDPVNATSPLLQFERRLGATKEDAVEQIFLDPKLAKGKRPGESELGGRLCAAISLTSSSSLLQRRAGPTVTFSVSSRSVIRRGICSGEKRKSFRGVPESAIRAPGTWVRLFSQCALPQREAQCSKFQVVVFLCAREEGLDGGGAASGCRYADSNTVVAQLMRLPTST